MSASSHPSAPSLVASSLGTRVRWASADALALTRRNLLRYVRLPQLLLFSTVQPVMLVLLFTYVFGGAIDPPGVSYVDYLVPGVFVQAVLFGSIQTGVGLADDLSRGMVDRFRSLPMARSAVLAGRTLSDSVRNTFVVLLMTAVGYLVGFRFTEGFLAAAAAVLLVVAFGFAFSWVSAAIGLVVKDPEATQAGAFVWLFPLVFASSVFVPPETMPAWLEAFADINPISVTANGVRALAHGGPTATHVLQSLAWIAVILAVFVPLSVKRYRESA